MLAGMKWCLGARGLYAGRGGASVGRCKNEPEGRHPPRRPWPAAEEPKNLRSQVAEQRPDCSRARCTGCSVRGSSPAAPLSGGTPARPPAPGQFCKPSGSPIVALLVLLVRQCEAGFFHGLVTEHRCDAAADATLAQAPGRTGQQQGEWGVPGGSGVRRATTLWEAALKV
jgi:hypothetical protein